MTIEKITEPWPCDWDSHELAQLRRDASRSFREKLIWLEETTEFVQRLHQLNKIGEYAEKPRP